VILFHDYRCRPHYHVVEAVARVIGSARDLSAFVRRPDVLPETAARLLAAYRLIPA
jgi:hypothetical protein